MLPPPPTFPLRRTPPLPWRPLTDAEWDALTKILRPTARGRPPADARRTWNGIFWVACSRLPWRAMPAEFGKPDTAHRALRRAAQAKQLHSLLLRVSPHPELGKSPLHAIAWFILRAFRRAFRVAPHAIAFARRLGLADALPSAPCWLPNPDLSETVKALAAKLRDSAARPPLELLRALLHLTIRAGGAPRRWRTTG